MTTTMAAAPHIPADDDGFLDLYVDVVAAVVFLEFWASNPIKWDNKA